MIRLATFNMESFGDERFDAKKLAPRLDALRPRLLELEADILCLQEVNAQKVPGSRERQYHALDALLAKTPYEDYHRVSSTREGTQLPADRHNLLVLSHLPIVDHKVHHGNPDHAPEWHSRLARPAQSASQAIHFDRPFLKVSIDIGLGKPLHLFVVHLRAPIAATIPGGKSSATVWKNVSVWADGYFLATLKRAGQGLELRHAANALFDEDPEALIAAVGDFNAIGDSSVLRLLLADPDDTGNPDLACYQLHQMDAALPLDRRRSVVHRGKGQALDHILASPSLFAIEHTIEVFNARLADEVLDAGTDADNGSFHAAMRASFAI